MALNWRAMASFSGLLKRLGLSVQSAETLPERQLESAATGYADAQAHAATMALARQALRARDFAAAIGGYRAAIDLRHDDAEAWCEMA